MAIAVTLSLSRRQLAVLSGPHEFQWAQLLARVFSLEVTVCPRCGGQMRMIAALTDPDSTRTYLTGVGLPTVCQVFSYAAAGIRRGN